MARTVGAGSRGATLKNRRGARKWAGHSVHGQRRRTCSGRARSARLTSIVLRGGVKKRGEGTAPTTESSHRSGGGADIALHGLDLRRGDFGLRGHRSDQAVVEILGGIVAHLLQR